AAHPRAVRAVRAGWVARVGPVMRVGAARAAPRAQGLASVLALVPVPAWSPVSAPVRFLTAQVREPAALAAHLPSLPPRSPS
ncbi:MAG: hypothetical protein K8W52_09650, partial [Deltaproteobacteria bacterium]|nr:hypothetical protein [Deltaproteobacteria bacterium]